MFRLLIFLLLSSLFTETVLAVQCHDFLERPEEEIDRDFLVSLARPLQEDLFLYRWQSATAREKLLNAHVMTTEMMNDYMAKKSAFGGGFYMAENIKESAEHSYGTTLIRVKIPKGSLILETTNRLDFESALFKNTGWSSFEDAIQVLQPPVISKFDLEKFYVAQKEQGVGLTFESVNFSELSDHDLLLALNNAKDSNGNHDHLKNQYPDEENKLKSYTRHLEDEASKRSLSLDDLLKFDESAVNQSFSDHPHDFLFEMIRSQE